jgi:hypothetical protein
MGRTALKLPSMNFQEALLNEIRLLLLPIATAFENGLSSQLLTEVTGWKLGPGSAPALGTFIKAYNSIDDLIANPPVTLADVPKALENANQLFTAARQLPAQPGPDAQALGELTRDLVQALVIDYLKNWHAEIFDILGLLTVIEPSHISLDRISDLISDPLKVLRAQYLPPQGLATAADAKALADKLFPRLAALLLDLGYHAAYRDKPENGIALGDIGNHISPGILSVFLQPSFGVVNRYGVMFALSSKDLGNFGLVVIPFGTVLPYWDVEVDLTAASGGFAVGPQGFTMFGTSNPTGLSITPTILKLPGVLIGSTGGTRLEIGQFQILGDVNLIKNDPEYGLVLDLGASDLVISAGDGDGFLQSVLPPGGLRTDFDLAVGWSNKKGLYFRGSAGLDVTLPVGISIGGVLTIPTVHLGLQASDAAVTTEVSASIGLSIGPVQALVDRIGITSAMTFPEDGGNLGVVDLAFAFKPPSGVGLVVDTGGASGGGFLDHDEAKHEYAGMLQLEFTDLTLQAFGLITTQVANGNDYSLLALIDADFPPVQLGWGFTLDGVGGLVAVHRTASVDALRAALKADQLSAVLFPKNPITDAPRILAQLETMFPTAPGRFLFGPMALIGWGTPTVLTAAIAVVLELPEPVRILLLARIVVRAPMESNALVRINLDALGVLDLGKGELSLDATLFDSRLLTYTLSGDMALRAAWSGQREFLLAIGGFHPRFTPPVGFPTLQRIAIDMPSGIVSKLRLAAYLAITSNTVQLGAELDVFIGVSGFGLAGHLGFDALLQFDPFHFEVDISGTVALKASGDDLMSVSLDATLTGPAPFNISGNFKIHIVFFDVHTSFSHSWGQEAPAIAATLVDVGQLLSATFADPRSWDARLPSGVSALVAVRQIEDSTVVLAHPLALPEVHERIVPLGLDITRFGDGTPSGPTRFAITDLRLGQKSAKTDAVQDDFAPAQFFDLSDEEKLARPSFERHDAGVILSGALLDRGTPVPKDITYETYFVDAAGGALRQDPGTPPQSSLLSELLMTLEIGSAGRAVRARAASSRYAAPGNPVAVAEPRFVLVDTSSLAGTGTGPATGTTYSDAAALLAGEIERDPSQRKILQILATHEMVNA